MVEEFVLSLVVLKVAVLINDFVFFYDAKLRVANKENKYVVALLFLLRKSMSKDSSHHRSQKILKTRTVRQKLVIAFGRFLTIVTLALKGLTQSFNYF